MQRQMLTSLRRAGGAMGELTTAQKVVAALALAAVVLGGAAFARWVTAPTMSPLFTNLAASDASAIVEQLDSEGARYELADGGQTVLVPRQDVYRLRLSVSAAGLPGSGDSGYALLDQQGVTTSQFQQQVTWQRALEGELSKTIGAINGVEAAVVHLAIPKKDVFLNDTSKPTASVLVDTRPGVTIPGQQVQAIVHLVASSVEGMSAADVTVVDDQGQLLSAAGQGAAAAAGGAREQQTADYEASTAAALQAMLDRVLGQGRSVATVSAELDFDNTDRTSETFTANEGVPPLASSTTTEEYTGGGAPVGGVLGPDNIQVPAGEGGQGSYTKESSTSNNAVNKVTEHTTTAPGAVRRQSVAVVVDTGAAGAVTVEQLTEMVTTAAGVDAARGDTVAVSRMPFDTSASEAASEALAAEREQRQRAETMSLVRQGLIALAVLVAVIVAVLMMRRGRREGPIDLGRLEMVPAGPLLPEDGTQVLDPAPDLTALPGPRSAADAVTLMRDEVTDLVERQPEDVAELLRGWLADRRS